MKYHLPAGEGASRNYCRMCSYRCGIEVHVSGGKLIKIKPDRANPFSRGRICLKAKAIGDLVHSPYRLLQALKKTGTSRQELGSERAHAEIAGQIVALKKRYGPHSIGVWKGEALGSGSLRDLAHLFALSLGTPNIFSNDTLCAVSKKAAVQAVLGAYPFPDIDNARSILVWGANPRASHTPLAGRIRSAARRGLQVVLIDPRRSSFARDTDRHIQLRPATDGALALGLINRLIDSGAYDRDFVAEWTTGFAALKRYASSFNSVLVETLTGVSPEDQEFLANLLAVTSPASCFMVGSGPEHHDNGFNNVRAIAALAALCGTIDRPGGSIMPESYGFNPVFPPRAGEAVGRPIGSDHYPVFYQSHREGHTILALEAALNSKPYPLRALIITGANPALTNPQTTRVKEALSSLDLLVVRDLFLTETAELAHYVLPAASFLEREELVTTASPGTIALTPKVLEVEGCMGEYAFFRDLAHRTGGGRFFPWPGEEEFNNWILQPLGLTAAGLARQPGGIHIGTGRREKYLDSGFATSSGKVELSSTQPESRGYPVLPLYKPPAYTLRSKDGGNSFVLITGGRISNFNHSCYHNIPRLKRNAPPPFLEMSPEDAARLGLHSGDVVDLSSAAGSLRLKLLVTEPGAIPAGFLHLPHGFTEANANLLTTVAPRDPVSGFPAVKSVPVELDKVKGNTGLAKEQA